MNDRNHSAALRVAILGAGGIAETHSEVLGAIHDVTQVGICDMQVAKAESFARKMNLPASYSRLETMLAEAKPDVVHLAVSPAAHAPTALLCLDAGVSVFMEKPLCLSSRDCARVAQAAARSGATVGVNHNMVFNPAVDRMIQGVRQGRLGQIEHVSIVLNLPTPEIPNGPFGHFTYQQTGNVIFELGAHPLSLVHRLFGNVLEARTLLSGAIALPSGVTFYSKWQIAMRCDRGTANLLLALGSGFEDVWVHLQGEDGACHADVRRNTVTFNGKRPALGPNSDLFESIQAGRSLAADGFRHYANYLKASLRRKAPYPSQFASMDASIRAFYRALTQGGKPPMSEVEGSAVVRACETIAAQAVEQAEYAEVSAHG